MAIDKFVTADGAVALIRDGDTVALIGGGGGLVEATCLHAAIEKRFLETGHPRDLTVIHSLGIGDRKSRGMNRFAHEGMVKRVIGGHWVWSPRMQELARDDKIEAYVLPGGVAMQLFREIGAGRPGLFTHVGLGTFVDPRVEGGRMNKARPGRPGRGRHHRWPGAAALQAVPGQRRADPRLVRRRARQHQPRPGAGQRRHLCGGARRAQFRRQGDRAGAHRGRGRHAAGARGARAGRDRRCGGGRSLPAMGYDVVYDPTMSGERSGPSPAEPPQPFTVRQVIARRAADELDDGAVLNYGFGIPDGVAKLIAERGHIDRYYQTIEHGTYGGELLDGTLFGFARNASAMIDAPSQFDFYSGGGLDIAFLGFGEIDATGNVNVSKLGGVTVGPGGFIDIAQNARKVVFCGTFDAKGAELAIGDGTLAITRHGEVTKLVARGRADHLLGARGAARRGQRSLYVTERAVFRLTPEGMVLAEVAPGIDVRRDVLERMALRAARAARARGDGRRPLHRMTRRNRTMAPVASR